MIDTAIDLDELVHNAFWHYHKHYSDYHFYREFLGLPLTRRANDVSRHVAALERFLNASGFSGDPLRIDDRIAILLAIDDRFHSDRVPLILLAKDYLESNRPWQALDMAIRALDYDPYCEMTAAALWQTLRAVPCPLTWHGFFDRRDSPAITDLRHDDSSTELFDYLVEFCRAISACEGGLESQPERDAVRLFFHRWWRIYRPDDGRVGQPATGYPADQLQSLGALRHICEFACYRKQARLAGQGDVSEAEWRNASDSLISVLAEHVTDPAVVLLSSRARGKAPPDLLVPPFGAEHAAVFRGALSVPQSMTQFIDFVIRELISDSHSSVFWGDRLLTIDKSAGFLDEPAFREAFERVRGSHTYDQYASPFTIAWRLHTLVWAAHAALALPEGDFVECGVFKGDMAFVVGEATGFIRSGRQFHLYDSFQGFDPAQTTEADFPDLPGFLDYANTVYRSEGLWDAVQARFRGLPQYHLHQGYLPDTLDHDGAPERIAWLHIDLNVAQVEIACLDRLFDRVVSGGMIVFDDYGWKAFHLQKEAHDAFFANRNYRVLELPTGQGLVVKR